MLRRGRFEDLTRRQLDLFAAEETALLAEAKDADASWTRASREDAEELYGDYQLVVDAIGVHLHDVRETYAASLDDLTAGEYRGAFNRAASKRFGRLAAFLDGD
jgi:hypothetical protein